MKKQLLLLLIATTISLATFYTASASTFQENKHKIKSGKLDHRYHANQHVRKDCSMELPYKSSRSTARKFNTKP